MDKQIPQRRTSCVCFGHRETYHIILSESVFIRVQSLLNLCDLCDSSESAAAEERA